MIEFFLHVKGARNTTKGDVQMGDISFHNSHGNRIDFFVGIDTHECPIQTGISFVDRIFFQWHSGTWSVAAKKNKEKAT